MIQNIITILLIIINILLIMTYIYERDKIEKVPIILIVLENIFATMIDDGVFKSIFDR